MSVSLGISVAQYCKIFPTVIFQRLYIASNHRWMNEFGSVKEMEVLQEYQAYFVMNVRIINFKHIWWL